MSEIQKFEPAKVRDQVITQLQQMQAAKFAALPEDFKETVYFAIDKLTQLEGISNVPAIQIAKAMITLFKNKLDITKNHCYLYVINSKESETGKGLMFGMQYQGLIHLVKTECNVREVTPVLVHENDVFKTHYEFGALIIDEHIPTFEGEIKGGYCVVDFGSNFLVRYFPKAELEARRKTSKSPNGNFWKWEREMYEKTLINATLKRIIETSGAVDDSILADDERPENVRQIEDADIIPQNEPEMPFSEPVQLPPAHAIPKVNV